MLRLYFDLETTSKWTNNARILELAYILIDDEFMSPTKMGDIFFYQEQAVPPSAASIHGLTQTKLEFLSKGKQFFECADEVYKVFSSPNLVLSGYNSNTYDLQILQRHFEESGVPRLSLTNTRDVYRQFQSSKAPTVNQKLGTAYYWALSQLEMKESEMKQLFVSWCDNHAVQNVSLAAHGALYDSFMTFIVDRVLQQRGI